MYPPTTIIRITAAILVLLAALLTPSTARADDWTTFDVEDVNTIPDLTRLFRRQPIMGECPMGDSSRADALPTRAHLLHLGTTGFYLDFRRKLDLTTSQVDDLRRIRGGALSEGLQIAQQLEEAESELWSLTGSRAEQSVLERQVREVEHLEAEERWLYLQAVVEAAEVLTPSQQAKLIGNV